MFRKPAQLRDLLGIQVCLTSARHTTTGQPRHMGAPCKVGKSNLSMSCSNLESELPLKSNMMNTNNDESVAFCQKGAEFSQLWRK